MGLRDSKGFTLVEILIALVILSVSLLALAGLMATVTKNNSYGGHITEATTFAQDKLEELRAMKWDDIPEGANTDQKPGSTGIGFARRWNVIKSGNLRTINIAVDWNDRVYHSIRLLSVISR